MGFDTTALQKNGGIYYYKSAKTQVLLHAAQEPLQSHWLDHIAFLTYFIQRKIHKIINYQSSRSFFSCKKNTTILSFAIIT